MIADRKHHLRVYRRLMVGGDMVDWLVQRFPSLIRSRGQAVGVWQALLEEGVLVHGIAALFIVKKHDLIQKNRMIGAKI